MGWWREKRLEGLVRLGLYSARANGVSTEDLERFGRHCREKREQAAGSRQGIRAPGKLHSHYFGVTAARSGNGITHFGGHRRKRDPESLKNADEHVFIVHDVNRLHAQRKSAGLVGWCCSPQLVSPMGGVRCGGSRRVG